MKKETLAGYTLMIIYVIITALSLITVNTYEKTIPTGNIALYSFSICALFFNILNIKNTKSAYKKIFDGGYTFINLNLITFAVWACTLFGLNNIEPVLFVMLYMATMPLTSCLINYLCSEKKMELGLKILLLSFILCLLCVLVKKQVPEAASHFKVIQGVVLAILAGAMSSIYIHYTRRLQITKKLTTIDFLSYRFYLTIIFSIFVLF